MPALTDAQQRIAELTALNALAQTLNRALDLREALDAALPHIIEVMGLRTGWIFLRDEAGAFRLAARHDLPPAIDLPRPGLVGRMQLPGAVHFRQAQQGRQYGALQPAPARRGR